jgi:hypothetical protein
VFARGLIAVELATYESDCCLLQACCEWAGIRIHGGLMTVGVAEETHDYPVQHGPVDIMTPT